MFRGGSSGPRGKVVKPLQFSNLQNGDRYSKESRLCAERGLASNPACEDVPLCAFGVLLCKMGLAGGLSAWSGEDSRRWGLRSACPVPAVQ